MYLQVKFSFDREVVPVIVPTAAIIVRTKGPRIAVVDEHDQIHYRDVKLGSDFGEEVELLSGLKVESAWLSIRVTTCRKERRSSPTWPPPSKLEHCNGNFTSGGE